MAAFEASWALGVRSLETDTHTTSDGVAVALHDSRLDRTTSLCGPVGSYTWEQLRRTGEVVRIDTLLDTFRDCELLIDVKEQSVISPLATAIKRTGAQHRVWVAGAWDGWLAAVVAQAPGTHAAMGWRQLSSLMWSARYGRRLQLRRATRADGPRAAHVPWRLSGVSWLADERVAVRLAEMTHDLGVLMRAWTINEPENLRRLVDLGVASVITDRPDLARGVLIERGLWRPMSGLQDGSPRQVQA